MRTFVLEIGAEELPARFLPGLEKELAERFAAQLAKEMIACEGLTVSSTPRRAVVRAVVAETAAVREELFMGPPQKAAYDTNGNFSKAAEGFAGAHGISVESLLVEKTEKGNYLAIRKHIGGETSFDILRRICPEIIGALGFPKRMHWGAGAFTYARPLRWIAALLDADILPFTVGDIVSGRTTFGHRIHGWGPFEISHASDYAEITEMQCRIIGSAADRRRLIVSVGNSLAEQAGGRVIWKETLLDEVQGLCEYPVPLLGSFDSRYLAMPREVLLSSMETHQKSFGLEAENGSLLPFFLTVSNTVAIDMDVVKKGWERVLRARLEDARFFWESDLSADAEDWLASLDTVIFLAPLGSMGDKTRRLAGLMEWLSQETGKVNEAAAQRIGRLSKADIVSGMVGEFDVLQGIMGGIYAARAGESDVVSTALREQYLPAGPETPVPSSCGGALLSIVDKADTLVACFGLGMIPTGAVDPYALRRCCLGIIRIILEHGLDIDVTKLFAKAQALYGLVSWKLPPDKALAKLMEFFITRLKNYLTGQSGVTLLAESVLSAGAADVRSVVGRFVALQDFSATAEFPLAVQTFKRVANIVRKYEQENKMELPSGYQAHLLREDAEKQLGKAVDDMGPRFDVLWEKGDYAALLCLIGELRPVVDAFFTSVMVMTEDIVLRENRLALLRVIVKRLGRLADFTALQM